MSGFIGVMRPMFPLVLDEVVRRGCFSVLLTWNQPPALREHLLAQVQIPPSIESLRPVNPASPHDRNIDPAIAGPSMIGASADESGGDDHVSDDRKGAKRELSTSKRAAQNRAAQVRAFHVVCLVVR